MDLAEVVSAAVPGLRTSARIVDRAAAARDSWPRRLIGEPAALSPGPDAEAALPALVTWPEHSEQVEQLVVWARQHGVPLVPYGAGSGVCAAVRPDRAAVVVDTKRLTGLKVASDRSFVDVEAGVLGVDLEAALDRQGLTTGHFPSSILCSTVGGWLAARSAGQCSSRYGKIEDMVLSAASVLGTGDAVRFVRRSGGPNPLGLLIGCEGTLGIITSARLRLNPRPAARSLAAWALPSFELGAEGMRALMQAGLRPAVMRLYDPIDSFLLSRGKVQGEHGARRSGSGMPSGAWLRAGLAAPRLLNGAILGFERWVSARATLILIFEGEIEQVHADAARAASLLGELGAESLGEGPARAWWEHRYAVSYRQSNVFQQRAFNDTFEIAAPWARLSDVYAAVRSAAGAHALVLAHLSHAYPDGCSIYFTLVGTRRGDALSRYDALLDAVLGAALAEGATLSHHHGVGSSKAHFLDHELGGGLETLRRLRRAWDPDALLNPGALEPARAAPSVRQREPVPGIDPVSGIASFVGTTPIREIEQLALQKGLSLGLSGPLPECSLAELIEHGLPGAADPFSDPVRGQVCGLEADGPRVAFRLLPAPRRATGPDLSALCVGARGEFARVTAASLPLVRVAERRVSEPARPVELHDDERAAWQRLVIELGAKG